MRFKIKSFLLLSVVLLLVWNCAFASTWQIDGAISVIPDGMLSGEDEISALLIEEGITEIGANAFSKDPGLRLAVIPSTVQQIGEGAFEQCGPFLLQCTPGSEAMRFAQTGHIEYDADTTRRALLIGESDYPDSYTLSAPANDIDAVSHILPGFEITVVQNLTAEGLLKAIRETFAPEKVKEQDISLLFYSGHGLENGSLLGIDLEELTLSDFHRALDEIPGRKVLLLDCCYSGTHIPQARTMLRGRSVTQADQFNASVIAEFSPDRAPRMMRAVMPEDRREYFILTACAADELSWETRKGVRRFGVFTRYMAMGLGYDERDEVECDLMADADQNGVITIREIYEYAREEVAALNTPDKQNVQVYPTDADDLALYRAKPETLPMKKLGVLAYDACGGTGEPDRQITVIGEPVQLSSSVPVLFGHRFNGWSGTKGSNDATYQADEKVTLSGSTTLYAVWTTIRHEVTGDGSVWFKKSQEGLAFTDSPENDPIQRVRVDRETLSHSAYTLSSQGRTVTLQPEWLDQQSIGIHEIEIQFTDDMTVTLHFEIVPEIPKTGDTATPLLWLMLLACSILLLGKIGFQHPKT